MSAIDREIECPNDLVDRDWRLFVAQGLEKELADPREDIYTLEDGEPLPDQPGA